MEISPFVHAEVPIINDLFADAVPTNDAPLLHSPPTGLDAAYNPDTRVSGHRCTAPESHLLVCGIHLPNVELRKNILNY